MSARETNDAIDTRVMHPPLPRRDDAYFGDTAGAIETLTECADDSYATGFVMEADNTVSGRTRRNSNSHGGG